MTQIPPVVAPAARAGNAPTSASRADPQEFLQLLMAQVTHQNPLEPLSQSDILEQVVGLQTVARLRDLGRSLEELSSRMGMSAFSLAGRQVEVADPDDPAATVRGRVEKVRWEGKDTLLVIGDREFPLGSLVAVLST